jgi:hypothetical protein
MRHAAAALLLTLGWTLACAAGGPTDPLPAPAPGAAAPTEPTPPVEVPSGELLPEVEIPEGGRVEGGVIYDKNGGMWGCVSGGNDCAGAPVGMREAEIPAAVAGYLEIGTPRESRLVLPWSLELSSSLPDFPLAISSDVLRGFFVHPESPVEVAIIGTVKIGDSATPGIVYATRDNSGTGSPGWSMKWWSEVEKDWKTLGLADWSNTTCEGTQWRSVRIEEGPKIEVVLTERTEPCGDDAPAPTVTKKEQTTWTFDGTDFKAGPAVNLLSP